MHETAAMLLYLAERHGLTGMAPPLDDPDRARFLCRRLMTIPGVGQLAKGFALDIPPLLDGRVVVVLSATQTRTKFSLRAP